MEGKNRDVIRGPVPEFDQDVMKNATNIFGQISVSLASVAPMMSPKRNMTITYSGAAVAQWLRCCAGSIPAGVSGIFH